MNPTKMVVDQAQVHVPKQLSTFRNVDARSLCWWLAAGGGASIRWAALKFDTITDGRQNKEFLADYVILIFYVPPVPGGCHVEETNHDTHNNDGSFEF
jgi:hypothetical protein